ncbi:MAG: hypothetical protein WEB00_02390 [Dehalococcoidia bacterium]
MGYTAQAWPEEAGRNCDLHHLSPATWRLVEHPNKSIDEPWLALRWACDECKGEAIPRWADFVSR